MNEAPFTEHARQSEAASPNGQPAGTDEAGAVDRAVKLGELKAHLGGVVEFLRVAVYREGRRSRYVFTVRDPQTGEPVETRALDSEAVLTLGNFQAAVHAVTLETVKAPRRNSEDWAVVQAAIRAAAEVVDESDEERAEWRWRIERYIDDRLGTDPDEAVDKGEPFKRDGCIYLSRPRLQAFTEKVLHETFDKGEMQAALREQGFEHVRFGHQKAHYWASPREWQR